MAEPRIVSGGFRYMVDRPPAPRGPVFQNVGVYEIKPDAIISVKFQGRVSLPPGNWEIGVVQNAWNDRVTQAYSQGGRWYMSQDAGPILDILRGYNDIWLDTLGTGKIELHNPGPSDRVFSFDLEGGDTPGSPPIPGRRQRCNGTIDETLVYCERTLQLIAAILARKSDGTTVTLASSAGNTYGFSYRLEPAPGAPDFRFRAFFPARTNLYPTVDVQLWGSKGVNLKRPSANELSGRQVAQADAAYSKDCGIRPVPTGDMNLWNLEKGGGFLSPIDRE